METGLSRKSPHRPAGRHGPPSGGQPEGRRERLPPRRGARSDIPRDPDRQLIWGFHPVREALRSPRRAFIKLYATAAAAERLAPEIATKGITPWILTADELDRRLPADAVHQGVLAEVRPLETLDLSDLPQDGVVVVLDQVTDPHNVGAILRSAAAYNVAALIATERHSPAMTGVIAKAASGGLEYVPICTVVNLARALEELGHLGFLRVGLDSDGHDALDQIALRRPLALVLGAEGKGLRRLSRENCDVLARLDMPGPIRSLNVSNACAVALTILNMRLAR